jgi:ABC-type nitrate/sulfonate/bicarbonate transport system substrate-binding protein
VTITVTFLAPRARSQTFTKEKKMKILVWLLTAILSVPVLAAPLEVRIMRQTNVAIAPVLLSAIDLLPIVAKEQGLDIQVKTLILPNSGIANEMLLNKQLDISTGSLLGFGHIDAAQDGQIKLVSGLTSYQGALVCHGSVTSLKDLIKHKIAMHNIGSTQHLMLRQIAKEQYGDFFALDKNIMVMPDKVSTQMLLSGDTRAIQCHCCKAPEQNQLIAANRGLSKMVQADGKTMYAVEIVTYARADWLDQNPGVAKAWIEAIHRAKTAYVKDPLPFVQRWLSTDNLELDANKFIADNRANNQVITTSLNGADQYLNTTRSLGMIRGRDKTLDEIVWRKELARP